MKKILCVGLLFLLLGCANTHKNNNKNEKSIDWTVIKQTEKKYKNLGFITRINKHNESFYVKSIYWNMMNAKDKETIVRALAYYYGHFIYNLDNATGIYVKDSQTGKVLATYGVLSGVKIK